MIVWVTALRAEAEPLIDAFELRARSGETPWPLYLSADDRVALVVSGIGRTASAAASGWAHGMLARSAPVGWINAGIAGHGTGPVGRLLTAHKVIDAATDRVWYPPVLPGVALPSETVITVDRPERDFTVPGLYEMEAAGFLTATGRWATVELCQVAKVISDTPAAPPEDLSASRVSELMAADLEGLTELAVAVEASAVELAGRDLDAAALDPWLERWHFTVSQRRQLRRLLSRRRALEASTPAALPAAARDGAGALRALGRHVDQLAEA